MTEIIAVLNNLISNLPAILTAAGALIVVWRKLDTVSAKADSVLGMTADQNVALENIHSAVSAVGAEVRAAGTPEGLPEIVGKIEDLQRQIAADRAAATGEAEARQNHREGKNEA
jgi:hypothetical protein